METTVKLTSQTGYLLHIKRQKKSRWVFVLLQGSIVFARKICISQSPLTDLLIWLTYRNNVPTGQERLRLDLNADDLRSVEKAIRTLNEGYLSKAKVFRTSTTLSNGGMLTLTLTCTSAFKFLWKIHFRLNRQPWQVNDCVKILTHDGFDAYGSFSNWLNTTLCNCSHDSWLELTQKDLFTILYNNRIMYRYYSWRGTQE